MKNATIEEAVRDYVINEILYDKQLDSRSFSSTDSLVGLLTSLDIMHVVSFCEESFGIEIPDTDILPEHFEAIQAIADLVASRLRV